MPSENVARSKEAVGASVRTIAHGRTSRGGADQGGTSLAGLMVGAAGVVFGDIGTSPLYTMKTVLQLSGSVDRASAIGVLSLLLWTLFVITTLKYVMLAMRFDNDGEGGILALMSLITRGKGGQAAIVAIGVLGAALIYGDGAITPAISVLSAVEGLKTATPGVAHWILPIAVGILALLFLVQPLGTERIGKAFGPIMIAWFAVMALLGLRSLLLHPAVLVALDPAYGLSYLASHGLRGFALLGGVFLCVTGAEALYADMGHFGARPIRFAWTGMIFPALVLNYAGQAALVATGHPVGDNIFYALAPRWALLPTIILATVATIIASQSIITGAYSMTRQAMMLGWLPRLSIKQTSSQGYGQIYVAPVNWLLMVVTIGLTVGFRKSDSLAAAYGIAVSLTMLMTSCLLFLALRRIWNWSFWLAAVVAAPLLVIDASFSTANALKLTEGGYVPLVLAGAVYLLMWTWHHGSQLVVATVERSIEEPSEFLAGLERAGTARVPGTAVFLTRTQARIPPMLVWHVHHNKALHENVVILRVDTEPTPHVAQDARGEADRIGKGLWRVTLRYGFMEHPDIPADLAKLASPLPELLGDDVTYFIGHESVVLGPRPPGLFGWLRPLFAAMLRNSARKADYLRLPSAQVLETGRAIEI